MRSMFLFKNSIFSLQNDSPKFHRSYSGPSDYQNVCQNVAAQIFVLEKTPRKGRPEQ